MTANRGAAVLSFFLPQRWPLVNPRLFHRNNGFDMHASMGCTIVRGSGAFWPLGGTHSFCQ
jgi:hypothetical protein